MKKKSRNHETEDRLPTLESMPQVFAMTGMPVGIVKSLKQAGCPAFIAGNRIRLGELLKFFFATFDDEKEKLPAGVSTWREHWNKIESKRAQIKLDMESAQVMSTDEVSQFMARLSQTYFLAVKQILAEAPRELEQSTKEKIKLWGDEQYAALTKKLAEVKEV